MSPIGMYVKRRRQQRGWSLAELSRQSNIPYGTLRNIEQNERPVKPLEGTVRALAKALEEETPDILFALAGYGIPISQTEGARRHSVDILLESRPEWLRILQRVQDELPSEEQDHALHVLRVFMNMRNT